MTQDLAEARRLVALHALAVLDTGPDPVCDYAARIAQRVFGAEIALVALVGADRIWYKAAAGTTAGVVQRAHAFCNAAIDRPGLCFIPDASRDGRFASAPFVVDEPHSRFYAGAPLTTPEGERVGVVCVSDSKPRASIDPQDAATLTDLAALVMEHFQNRRPADLAGLRERQAQSDAMLACIQAAGGCDEALCAVAADAAMLLQAQSGRVWKMLTPETGLRELVCHAPPGPQAWAAVLGPAMSQASSVAVHAALAGTPRCIGIAELSGTGDPLAAVMAAEGTNWAIIQPASMGSHCYVLVLTLRGEQAAARAKATELKVLFATLTPSLQRKEIRGRLGLLTQALDAATYGVVVTEADPQGARIVYANAAFSEVSGLDFARLAGRSLSMLAAEMPGADSHALFASVLSDTPSRRYLCLTYERGSAAAAGEARGHELWVEIDVTPVMHPDGHVTNWIAVVRDVSERQQSEREAREHAASFRLMFQDNPLPMMLFEPSTLAIAEVNGPAMERYGYAHRAFTRLSMLDIVPEDDREHVRASVEQWGDQPSSGTWTHVCASGERIRVQGTTVALTFKGRRMRLAVFWDVTEMELARDALRQSNQELLKLAAQLQGRTADLMEVNRRAKLGMWRMPHDGGPAEWSQEMFEIFGRPVQLPGPDFTTALSWIADGDRARVREMIGRVTEQRLPQSFEFRAMQPHGGMRHCLADLQPAIGPRDRLLGLKGFCQDITERKETEMALLRSEKLKTIGQFTGGFAHDFNNLLTVMMLNVEEAAGVLPDQHPVQALLAPVLQAASRGSELTAHLLSYAKRSPLEPMHVSLVDLFDGLKPLLDRILGDRFRLLVQHSGGQVQPFVESAKLENAILNLVINARDAMTAGGDIVISTALITLDARNGGSWSEFLAGQYAVISVTDTGCGIPPDIFPRVFEPFFTTKAQGKGSGLGLSMVHGFAKQSGGHIDLASEVGAGTTATLYLPLRPRPDGVDPPKPAASVTRLRKIALLVEDQPEVLATVRRQLASLGFNVIVAADASRAMDHITGTAVLDLLFSDVDVPGPVDGAQLADIARQQHPNIRILLTSGFMAGTASLTSDLALATEFLQKPYSRADLAGRLAAMFPEPAGGGQG